MASVRSGAFDDIPALLALSRAMHAESPRFRGLPFDEVKVLTLLDALVRSGGVHIAENEGRLVGMVCGFVTEHFFGPVKIASDFALYVTPAHRGASVASRLVKAFETWARSMGADEITLGVSTEVHAERTAQLYERLGYARSGIVLRKSAHV